MKPRLIIEQKITAFANKYAAYTVNEAGEKGQLTALAQQKRLAFKEKVTFYTDDTKQTEAFTFRAEKVFDVHGKYIVEDAAGQQIGSFQKVFGKSLLRSTWNILDADNAVQYTVKESNNLLAILRRFLGFIPYVGDIFEIILLLFRYHFIFVDTGDVVRGKYIKTTLFRDHYRLEADDQLANAVDTRVLAAVAVGLDALQSR